MIFDFNSFKTCIVYWSQINITSSSFLSDMSFGYYSKIDVSEYPISEFREFVGIFSKWFWILYQTGLELILEECEYDEEKAFDIFFALLEEFKLENEELDLEIKQWEKASNEDLQKFEENLDETN